MKPGQPVPIPREDQGCRPPGYCDIRGMLSVLVLHLLSLISPVDVDLALVRSDLMPIPLAELLEAKGVEAMEVTPGEFATKGSTALALRPRRVLMVEGNPGTRKALEAEGVDVVTYEGEELSLNRDGGPTCLTLALERET